MRVPTEWRVRQPFSGRVRIPFVQHCRVEESGRLVPGGLLCDLSTAGAYLRLHPAPRAGARLTLSFSLFPGDELPIVAQAEVCWLNVPDALRVPGLPPGCGLRFVGLEPHDLDRIQGLVAAYQSAPLTTPA